jgi:Ca-activated chloride channel family protein
MTSPNLDETKLTAYALGELDETSKPEVEAILRDSAFARGYVQNVLATARQLTGELASERVTGLTAIQQASLEQRIRRAAGREPEARRTQRRWNRLVLAGSIAASILIVGLSAALLLPPLYRQFEPQHDDSQAVGHLPYIISDGSPADRSLPGSDNLPITRPPGPRIDQSDDAGSWSGNSSGPVVTGPGAPRGTSDDHPFVGAASSSTSGVPITPLRLISGPVCSWRAEGATPIATENPQRVSPSPNWFSAYENPAPANETPARGDNSAPQVDTDAYDPFTDNPFRLASNQPLSAFAPAAGFASYANIRRSIARGELPPADAVRVEELLNYFSWHTPKPTGDQLMSGNIELSVCPWNGQHRLARIVLQARKIPAETRPPVNLVFLIDVSSSMGDADKLPLVQRGLKLLLSQLGRRDRIAIVAAPQEEGFLLPPTPGDEHLPILDAIDRLRSGGKPAAGTGLETAYYAAGSSYIPGGINRVVLMTDGRWLSGTSNPESLAHAIAAGASTGISLGVVAVSPVHLDDAALRHLASAGKGTLSVIDSATDARKELFDLANGSLIEAAQDVRISVKVNPIAVESYRLIGYESHLLGDNVDAQAGEDVGAGHVVTALYELIPAKGADGSPLAVHVRCRPPGSEAEESLDLAAPLRLTPLSKASNDFYFASAVTEFAMLLRPTINAGNTTFASAIDLAQRGRGPDEDNSRVELIELMRKAEAIAKRQGG